MQQMMPKQNLDMKKAGLSRKNARQPGL